MDNCSGLRAPTNFRLNFNMASLSYRSTRWGLDTPLSLRVIPMREIGVPAADRPLYRRTSIQESCSTTQIRFDLLADTLRR
jgi:hypothetical protein